MSKTLPQRLPDAQFGPLECKTIRSCSGAALKMAYRTEAGLPVLPHVQDAIDHSILRDCVTEAGPLYRAKDILAIVPDNPQIGPAPYYLCKVDLMVTFQDTLGPEDRPPVHKTIDIANWPLF